ncbi:NAD(P)H-dependent flavin oxidoreductase [Caryophanon latum]|uniref:Probable nitronate monooxygenase n=1 Tax=Caryophanon latum TaxID=33977 RepID=A0A1C0YW21_9BACL|nr:nitronate monooxygenase [Caryophanon latum]OCS91345.1 2-nitropropane dioxygenase [Caryophanon latum]
MLPVIVAPMFLISTPQMVIESSKAGMIGTFPLLNARPASECAKWLKEVKSALPTEPWGVNFICHERENVRYAEDFALIQQYEPPIVITSLGNPAPVVEAVHAYGGKVYSDVIYVKHAKKAAAAGVDGLILVCAGAGGHGGQLNPFAFVSEVREFFDGIICLSGAISTGAHVAAAKLIGADYAYVGTRFMTAAESNSPEPLKDMLIESDIEDIVYTDAFSGVHANYLVPSIVANGLDPKNLQSKGKLDFSVMTDAKAWKDIWSAGQGVGSVKHKQTIAQIAQQLEREYKEALTKLTATV